MTRKIALLAATLLACTPAYAFDGWHMESATTVPSTGAGWDYVTYDSGTKHVLVGHRKDGLQVFDPATRKIVTTIEGTPGHSANGATLVPEFDLGVSNNEDGTFTPFKLSTLAAGPAVQLAPGIDTSHYDSATKRLVFNVEPGEKGTDLVVVDAATLKTVGMIAVTSKKVEGAAADGAGGFYLAGQDIDTVFKLDTQALGVTATWKVAECGKPTAIDVDAANKRLFVSCRGNATTKPAFVVLDSATGKLIWSVEIGGGSDSMIFDAATRRIFSANGVNANLSVIEQTDADHYKVVETLGTVAWLRTIAMDHEAGKLYGITAQGTSDSSKKILTAVSPWYINTIFPNTFTILSFTK